MRIKTVIYCIITMIFINLGDFHESGPFWDFWDHFGTFLTLLDPFLNVFWIIYLQVFLKTSTHDGILFKNISQGPSENDPKTSQNRPFWPQFGTPPRSQFCRPCLYGIQFHISDDFGYPGSQIPHFSSMTLKPSNISLFWPYFVNFGDFGTSGFLIYQDFSDFMIFHNFIIFHDFSEFIIFIISWFYDFIILHFYILLFYIILSFLYFHNFMILYFHNFI